MEGDLLVASTLCLDCLLYLCLPHVGVVFPVLVPKGGCGTSMVHAVMVVALLLGPVLPRMYVSVPS